MEFSGAAAYIQWATELGQSCEPPLVAQEEEVRRPCESGSRAVYRVVRLSFLRFSSVHVLIIQLLPTSNQNLHRVDFG